MFESCLDKIIGQSHNQRFMMMYYRLVKCDTDLMGTRIKETANAKAAIYIHLCVAFIKNPSLLWFDITNGGASKVLFSSEKEVPNKVFSFTFPEHSFSAVSSAHDLQCPFQKHQLFAQWMSCVNNRCCMTFNRISGHGHFLLF